MSDAIMISMPSVVEFCQLKDDCGLASAITSAATASDRRMIPKCLNEAKLLLTGSEKLFAADTLKVPCNFCSRHIYQPIITGTMMASQKNCGYANSSPLNTCRPSFRV